MRPEPVAVTGLGLLCGLGLDLESSFAAALEGRSPIRRFRSFDPAGLATPFGVELPEGAEELFRSRIGKRRRSQMTRGTMIAVVAASMALEDAALPWERLERSRVGVVVGATGTGYAPGPEPDPHRILRNMANAAASWISIEHGLGGPSFVVSTACSSGAYALASASALLASGACEVVVSGAADSSLNRADVEGFGALLALSTDLERLETASRPFDRRRDGFVIGEGGGMLVLESLDHARARGARVLAELHPPGLVSEAYNIMAPRPEGEGMARTMALALELAGLDPREVSYLNAHGTSTPLNDLHETRAVKRVFGEAARRLPISSTKSMTGHCLAGAAGVEAALCCKALVEGLIPPTANLEERDPELDLDYVPLEARRAELRHVMSSSYAFGGHNGVCLFSRPR